MSLMHATFSQIRKELQKSLPVSINQAQPNTRIIHQSIKKMSKHPQTNDHGDVNIDIDSLEKAQTNAKNEQNTKRLKETQSIQPNKDRLQIIWIVLKITLAVIACIVYNNYHFNQSMDQKSIYEMQRKLEAAKEKAKEEEMQLCEHLEKQFGYTNGQYIAQRLFGSVWKFKKDGEDVAIKSVIEGKYNKKELKNQQSAYKNAKIGQYVVRVQKEPAKQFRSYIWFEQELMNGDLDSLIFQKDDDDCYTIPKPDALTEGDVMQLMGDLAITLAELESMKISHNDVHPGNIMYKVSEGNYEFKLGDFGESQEGTGVKDLQYYVHWMRTVMDGNWEKPPPKAIENAINRMDDPKNVKTMKDVLPILVDVGILEKNWEEIEKKRNEERMQKEREKEKKESKEEEKEEKGVTAPSKPVGASNKAFAQSSVSKPLPSIVAAIVVVVVAFFMN